MKQRINFSKVLPMVAVIAALGAAIVPAHKSGAQGGTSYYWFDADGNYIDHATESVESSARGCSSGNDICAVGYSSVNSSGQPNGSVAKTLYRDDNN